MRSKPIRILQQNVRKERIGTLVPLLEDRKIDQIDILAIQEPWHNNRDNSSYNPVTSQFYLAHRGEENTRTSFCINKRLESDSWEVHHPTADYSCLKIREVDQGGETRGIIWIS